MTRSILTLTAVCALSIFSSPRANAAEPVSFVKDIAPIFVKNCQACHGAKKAESNYRTDTFETIAKAGDFETPPLTAGKIDESELFRLIASDDPDERMPSEGDPLTDDQIALVKRWIAEGAKFDGSDAKAPLSSIIPRGTHPDPPEKYQRTTPITALAFHPSGKELFVGGYHEITVWNPADGKLLRRIKNIAERTYALRFDKSGELLAVASGAPGRLGEVKIIKSSDGKEIKHFARVSDDVRDVAFSPDGKKLAAASVDRAVYLFDVASGKQERVIENHADWVTAVAFSPDGSKLATASRDKTAKVFDVKTGELVATYSGHGQSVRDVAFRPDGKQVYSSGHDKKIHLWNVKDGKKAAEIAGYGGEVFRIAIDGGQLYSVSADKSVRQHTEKDRKQVRVYSGHADMVFALAVHASSKRLASAGFDGEVRLWNTADGKSAGSFIAAPGYSPEEP